MVKNKTSKSKLDDAKEIAAFISRGLTPVEVSQKVDLPLGYVNELTRLPEFEGFIQHVGGDEAVTRWQEYTLDKAAGAGLRSLVRGRLTDYFEILNAIAMDEKNKPEVRFAVIKELLVQSKVSEDDVAPTTQELPPSFFTSLAEALKTMDEWEAKRVTE